MKAPSSRNAPCPCGSGRRFKDCHGTLVGAPRALPGPTAPPTADALAQQGLAAHQAGRLEEAETLYRRALEREPQFADVLHMLGVVRMERGDPLEGTRLILSALDLTDWQYPEFTHNLGLAIARAMSKGSAVEYGLSARGYRYRAAFLDTEPPTVQTPRLVSVLVPSFNHGRFIERAIESVFAQTWPDVELIVIDDGSTDDTPAKLKALQLRSPLPFELVLRENRGAAATLNEAVRLARGTWLHPLNSDDTLTPNRIETLWRAIAERGWQWGFGTVEPIDATGQPLDPLSDPRAWTFLCSQSEIPLFETIGECFLTQNVAISTGNLFFSRALFERVGGFSPERWHHDWSFCLRAMHYAEPRFVPEARYHYRLHERNTISESAAARLEEVGQMLPPLLDRVFEGEASNPWAPQLERCGPALIMRLLSAGTGRYIRRDRIRALANELLQGEAHNA